VLRIGEERMTSSAEQTEALGESLAELLEAGDVVLLRGGLAAGKTTLVRGLVRGLGGTPEEVSSPSFVVVQSYTCRCGGIRELHHVDLYRIADEPHALRELGLEELLSGLNSVTAVEWPNATVCDQIPPVSGLWTVTLEPAGEHHRRVTVTKG